MLALDEHCRDAKTRSAKGASQTDVFGVALKETRSCCLSKHVTTSCVMHKVLRLRQYWCGSALRQAKGANGSFKIRSKTAHYTASV